QILAEGSVSFVAGLIGENTAAKHKILHVFVPYVYVVFSFILVSNFAGMVPYSFTVTSSLAVTFAIAAASFIGVNIVGARIHKLGFLAIFLPPGCPIFISPFIILIETVSYIARVLSLSIRLFANMMAGHTLLKILAGFA
ncbi:MAG: F0F1 ATP synthase subunit A, partial [Bacteroidota bacterium]